MRVQELYGYKRMTASGMVTPLGGQIGGFIATTAGTVQITEGEAAGGNDIMSSIAVTAGQSVFLGIRCPLGAYAVLAGGAVVTFFE